MPRVNPDPQTIQIKNPRVIQLIIDEHKNGAGRSPTESAENLIAEAAELRRSQRSEKPSRRSRQHATSAA